MFRDRAGRTTLRFNFKTIQNFRIIAPTTTTVGLIHVLFKEGTKVLFPENTNEKEIEEFKFMVPVLKEYKNVEVFESTGESKLNFQQFQNFALLEEFTDADNPIPFKKIEENDFSQVNSQENFSNNDRKNEEINEESDEETPIFKSIFKIWEENFRSKMKAKEANLDK